MPTSTDSGVPSLSQPFQNAGPFFVSGGTLHPGAPSYVERQADDVLLQTLLRGEFCYILDTRQVGKSSLMVRTKARLEEAGVRVAILDLTTVGRQVSIAQWYEGLVSMLGEQLGLEDEIEGFWDRNRQRGPLQGFELVIRKVVLPDCSSPLVIFVDEIDAVRSLPFSTDEFFAAVRAFFNQRAHDPSLARLTFCMLGVASPAELVEDTKTTPFNIGRRIELTDFSADEAAPLAAGLGRDRRTGSRRLRRVLYWTGGHPYLTQRLCEAVAAGAAPNVDRLCRSLFFTQESPEQDGNLAFVRRRLLESDTDLAGLLDFYRRLRYSRRRILCAEADPRAGLLRLSGIAGDEAGCLRVRNRIYARVFDRAWIRSVMPGAELRRQRVAFWKGVSRTLAVTVLLLGTVWFGGGAWLDRDPVVTIPKRTAPVPNAYDDFENAMRSLTSATEVDEAYAGADEPIAPQDKADMVQRNAAALHWLRLGLVHGFRHMAWDSAVADYRSLARLLVLEGQVRISRGDWGAAAQSDLDAIALGERVMENGPLVNREIGVAFEAIGQRALEKTISHLSISQANAVTGRLTSLFQTRFPFWETLREDKWQTESDLMALFDSPHWRDTYYRRHWENQWKWDENSGLSATLPKDTEPFVWVRVGVRMELMTSSKRATMAEVTQYADACIELTRKNQYGSTLRKEVTVPDAPGGMISSGFTLPLSFLWLIDTASETRTRLLLMAAALRAYRLASGHYPKTLYQLKPTYLKILPDDPFDSDDESVWSAPLHYTTIGDTYLLYSVGPDGRDDHGQPIRPGDVNTSSPGDLVFGHLLPTHKSEKR